VLPLFYHFFNLVVVKKRTMRPLNSWFKENDCFWLAKITMYKGCHTYLYYMNLRTYPWAVDVSTLPPNLHRSNLIRGCNISYIQLWRSFTTPRIPKEQTSFCVAFLGSVCFNFSSLLWISFREIQKLDGLKSEKLKSSWKGASSFSFLELFSS
jgi:hypothetical protein